ncbi:MAG TPA: hypothetical protein VM911_09715 [Pyrinomonadaceae bacterium]|jgi:hypothetical protein|nr:hypothetical protein [Pyrinomonadaceae bacterium]
MAEERNLATVRAPESTDEDVTKEELQRRMEEARESITQTVTEIKDTVANQYQAVRETVTEALDWREQFRKRPVAFSVGALSVGFIVGYTIAGTFKDDDRSYYYDAEDTSTGLPRSQAASPASAYYGSDTGESRSAGGRSYAAQALTGSSYGSSDFDESAASGARREAGDYSPATSVSSRNLAAVSGGQATETSTEETPKGPGLIEKFKTTKAYDRLEEEVTALGDRFINELSKTAQTVVLPALFSKVKELFGVDLSNKEGEGASGQRAAGTSAHGRTSAETNAALSGGAQSSFAGVNRGTSGREDDSTLTGRATTGDESGAAGGATATGGTSTSYATSENRGYGASAGSGGSDYKRGSD